MRFVLPDDWLTVDYTYCNVDHETGKPIGETKLCKCRTRYSPDTYPEGCPKCNNLGIRHVGLFELGRRMAYQREKAMMRAILGMEPFTKSKKKVPKKRTGKRK